MKLKKLKKMLKAAEGSWLSSFFGVSDTEDLKDIAKIMGTASLSTAGLMGLSRLGHAVFDEFTGTPKIPTELEISLSDIQKKKKEKQEKELNKFSMQKQSQDEDGGIIEEEPLYRGWQAGLYGVPAIYATYKFMNALDRRQKDIEYARKIKEYENVIKDKKKIASLYREGFTEGFNDYLKEQEKIEKKADDKKDLGFWDFASILPLYYASMIPLGFAGGYQAAKYMLPVPGGSDMATSIPKIKFVAGDKKKKKKGKE